MAWQLLIAVVLYVVGELIRKPNFPEDREATPFEEARIPQIDPRKPKTILWGKDTIRAAHVMDVVDWFTIPLKEKVQGTLFKSKNVIIGHRYFVGIQLGLGLGEGGWTLETIYYDDKVLWEGVALPSSIGVGITIDEPQFLGGKEEGGGIVGTFRFYGGRADQIVNNYLLGFHDLTTQPAYRHVAYIVLEGVEVGETPSIDGFGFECLRYPNNLALGANRQIDGEIFNADTNLWDVDVDSELNPAELLYELWTNTRWGMRRPRSEMDDAQWAVSGNTLATEIHGISLAWRNRESNKRIAEIITRQIQALVVFNPTTGLWELRLARFDYVVASLPLFTETTGSVELRNFSRILPQELITQTLVKWQDRTVPDPPPPAKASNMALFYALGSRHQPQEINMPGIKGPTLAFNVASRENNDSSFAIATLEIEVDRSAFKLLPNDPFRWGFDPLGIVQIVFRVVDISPGKTSQGSFAITAIQDRFALKDTIYKIQPPQWTPITAPPANILDMLLTEQPWYLVIHDPAATIDETGVDASEVIRPLVLVEAPAAGVPQNIQMYFERNNDAAPVAGLAQDILGDYTPKADLDADLGLAEGIGSTVVVRVTGMRSREAALVETDTLTTVTEGSLANLQLRIQYEFLNLVLFTDPADITYAGVTKTDVPKQEFMAIEALARVAGTNDFDLTLRRGLSDTPPQPWTAIGTEVWFVSLAANALSAAVDLQPFDDFVDTEDLTVGVTNLSEQGESALATAVSRGMTMVSRGNLPAHAGNVKLNTEFVPTVVVALGGDVDITWNHRNRLSVNVAESRLEMQFHNETDADDITPFTGSPVLRYRLEIYDDLLNNLERTVTQNTLDFSYTNALQVTDGGPFARLRIELRVEQNAGGAPLNLVDVIRVINVRINLQLLQRGPVYDVIETQAPQTHYPCQEASGNLANVGPDGGGDLVANGSVAYRQPGPDNHTFSVFMPAGVGNYLLVADDATNDLITTTPGSMISCFMRCSTVDGVNNTVIWSKGSITDIDTAQIQLYLDTGGKLNFRGTGTSTFSVRAANAPRMDDGLWHYIAVWFQNGVFCWVDNEPYAFGAGTTFPAGAQPMWFGCGNDSTSAGVVDMAFAHIHWYKQDTPANVGIGTTPWHFAPEAMRPAREAVIARSPYLRQVIAENPLVHYIGGGPEPETTVGQEHNMMDFMLTGSRSRAERPHFTEGDSLEQIPDANMHLDGPMVGQANNFAWDQGGVRSSFFACEYGGISGDPQVLLDVSLTSTEHTFCGWIFINATPSQRSPISVVAEHSGANPIGPVRMGMYLNSSLQLEVYSTLNGSNGNNANAVIEEADDALLTGRWYFVGYRKTDLGRPQIMLDGRIVASTETVNGTGVSLQWWDDWTTGGRPRQQFFGSAAFSDDTSSGGETHQPIDALLCQLSVWPEEYKGVDTFERMYKAAYLPEHTMSEILLRDNPENFYAIETSTDAADQLANAADGQPTATGTYELDTLPIEADPIPGSVLTPLGFLGDARLAYASGILEGVSTTDIDDIAVVAVFRARDVTGEQQIVLANQPAAESSGDTNVAIISKKDANDSVLWNVFPPGAEGISTPDNTLLVGDGVIAVVKETGSGVGKAREMWIDTVLEASDSGDLDEYTGAAITRLMVGNRNTDLNAFLDGDVGYIATYGRAIAQQIIVRAALRFQGRTADEIAVLQHGIANPDMVLYMRGDNDLTQSAVMHNLVNDPTSEDLVLTNLPTSPAPGGVVPAGFKFARCLRTLSSSVQDASMGWIGTATFPFCFGGWFRVHTAAADAYLTMSDQTEAAEYVQVGIINDAAGIVIDGIERTSGAVTQGTWAHVVLVFVSAVSKFLYLNGELQTEFTVSEAPPVTPDILSINSRITTGATVHGDGEYVGIFAGNVNLSADQVMEIYSAGLYDGVLAAARHEGADMAYTLDEYLDANLTFQDSEDLTNVGVGTGVLQGAVGIIPLRKSLCVDFDGAGDIDLVRTDYPAGSTNRVIEFWVEAGFVGVVASMGANVDAQSLTIVVDAAGDVRLHIRGASNERIWTTALDVGTDPFHVAIELRGTLLTDINCYVDGVLATVGTAGAGTTINTTATENAVLGQLHANLTTLPGGTPYIDATGKLGFFAIYSAEWGSTTTLSARTALHHTLAGAG